jgi:Ca-activated chloride channel family protein
LVAGLKQLEMGRRDKKTLVLISDGGDNISSASFKDVWNMVLDSIATIYTIGIFDQDDPDRNPDVLRKLAQVSGGESFFPTNLPEIIPICKKIAQDVRNRYTIGYIPETNGKHLRHVKVTVAAPNYGKLIPRTRTTYSMPEEADRTQ